MSTHIIKIMQAVSTTGQAADARYVGRIENGSYMPLVLEAIGRGPNGLPAFSLAHVGTQNGDVMYDPEVCFELATDGKLYPYSFRNDYMGIMREVYIIRDGRKLVNLREKKDQESFLRQWGKNLKDQGFIEAAKLKARQQSNAITQESEPCKPTSPQSSSKKPAASSRSTTG